MATVFATKSFDMTSFSLRSLELIGGMETHLDEPLTVRGVTYMDRIEADFRRSADHVIFVSQNMTVSGANPSDAGDFAGTLKGIFQATGSTVWSGFQGITVDIDALVNAWNSPSRSDDNALIRTALSGNDVFRLSRFDDVALGHAGNDRMNGSAGNDRLDGGAGNDRLAGGAGDDTLHARIGTDILVGGVGQDKLNGGTDALGDIFLFRSRADSAVGSRHDVISNFTSGADDISLRAIDARTSTTGINEAFRFSGHTAADHSVWWKATAEGILVQADVNGDAQADLEIFLSGTTSIGANDLIL